MELPSFLKIGPIRVIMKKMMKLFFEDEPRGRIEKNRFTYFLKLSPQGELKEIRLVYQPYFLNMSPEGRIEKNNEIIF